MTVKEKKNLKIWCGKCAIAVRMEDDAIQAQQKKLLKNGKGSKY